MKSKQAPLMTPAVLCKMLKHAKVARTEGVMLTTKEVEELLSITYSLIFLCRTRGEQVR